MWQILIQLCILFSIYLIAADAMEGGELSVILDNLVLVSDINY